MNKKGVAPLVIGGISVGAIIYFLFQIWATGMVIGALEPALTEAMINLEGNMICPDEFSKEEYEICFGAKGEVVVNGLIKKEISLKLDEGTEICSIKIGEYDNSQICTINDIWRGNKIYATGIGLFNKKTLKISKLVSYAKTGQYLKILKIARKGR